MKHPESRMACLTALVVLSLTAAAQDKPGMSVVELLNVPQLSDPRLSPDGTAVVFTLTESDWEANERVGHIWRQSLGGGPPVQLTRGEHGESSPRWSPDGALIAFLTRRGEDETDQIYLLPSTGGEAERLTEHATGVSDIEWAPDGSALYFLADDPRSEDEQRREALQDDVYAFDENFKHQHLWRVALGDRSEHRVTAGEFSIRAYRLARGGAQIVVQRAPSPLLDDLFAGEVWLLDAAGGDWRQLTHNAQPESGAELSPDGTTVLFRAGANERFEPYYNDNLFVVPASGGPHRLILADMPYEVEQAHWSADGSAILFTANTGVRTQLFSVDVASETLVQLTEGDHAIRGWTYSPQLETHLASLSTATNPGDVWRLHGDAAERVTRVFDYLAERYFLPRQQAITWAGADGVTVEGIVYYPRGYQPGTRYPLIVQTHGGPAASDRLGFDRPRNFIPVATARGWLVFKPNYRGSVGYGDAFLRDMVGHYFNQAHLDVMTGIDHLIAEGLVDPDRMIKMGWSGGGHMTNKLITFTDRFRAASTGAGAANWISMYGQTDIRIHRGNWFGGSPWTQDAPIDTYWEHSPLREIWKVTTPTLVLVGENDARVPAPQSIELYRALRANGVDTHLYMAPREPHGWRELRHQLFKINVELEWFEKHALGRSYQWESAPETGREANGSEDQAT